MDSPNYLVALTTPSVLSLKRSSVICVKIKIAERILRPVSMINIPTLNERKSVNVYVLFIFRRLVTYLCSSISKRSFYAAIYTLANCASSQILICTWVPILFVQVMNRTHYHQLETALLHINCINQVVRLCLFWRKRWHGNYMSSFLCVFRYGFEMFVSSSFHSLWSHGEGQSNWWADQVLC